LANDFALACQISS